jgi:hypothetical protein
MGKKISLQAKTIFLSLNECLRIWALVVSFFVGDMLPFSEIWQHSGRM